MVEDSDGSLMMRQTSCQWTSSIPCTSFLTRSSRRLRSIRRSVSQAVLLSLVTSLIMTRLDYGSAVLAGLPSHLLNRLQSVLNAAMQSCVSGSQVRPRHSSAPGLALVTGSGKNTVPTGRTGFLLSQPQGAFISRRRASLDWRGGITASTTVRCLATPDRSANPAQHHRRQIIFCDCCTCMEQSSTSITALTSLPSFKRQLKTFLFTKSFPSV